MIPALSPLLYDDLIRAALREDMPYLDLTTDLVFPADACADAIWRAKADGVVCGLDIAARVFALLDGDVRVECQKADGDLVSRGDVIAQLHGPTRALLKGERTALNLLQHLSGIATATHALVEAISGTHAVIADTRKTLPGMRALQKYAVLCGGGRNHRLGLSDAVLLKDNHIDAMGGIAPAVDAVRAQLGHMVKIEVETRTLDEVRAAITAKADVIMLDNMDTDTMTAAVRLIDGRTTTEASGNISIATAPAIAACGVDVLSVGAITHSVCALDVSMLIALR